MDDEIEVEQGDAQLGAACAMLLTSGLGPCIAVAFVHNGEGYMMHYPAAHENTDAERFFHNVSSCIPLRDRSQIRPVVAGGKIGADDEAEEVSYTTEARDWVISQLTQHRFGTPHIHWCPSSADSQEMNLNVINKVLELVTWFDKPVLASIAL